MRIGLFIPCYVDQFFPQVGVATLRLLERFAKGTVEFPAAQTCCGQPMANAGCVDDARPLADRFVETFRNYDYIVAPSGSCVAMVRQHYHGLASDETGWHALRDRTFELCEFLSDVLQIAPPEGRFPHRVGIHQSCHGVRELQLSASSERVVPRHDKVRRLLANLRELTLVDLERADECCGFGGTFSVFEEAVSCMMGQDRIADHERAGAEVIASADMSCLMHLDGLIRRQGRPMRVMHVAEVLCAALGFDVQC